MNHMLRVHNIVNKKTLIMPSQSHVFSVRIKFSFVQSVVGRFAKPELFIVVLRMQIISDA